LAATVLKGTNIFPWCANFYLVSKLTELTWLLIESWDHTEITCQIGFGIYWSSENLLTIKLPKAPEHHFGMWPRLSSEYNVFKDCLCDLVVRVPGYRSRSLGFDSRRYQIFLELVDLERGPFSLVRITEELLEWKSSGSGSRKSTLTAVGTRCPDHATPSICGSWY
jgi:hypothetical protein